MSLLYTYFKFSMEEQKKYMCWQCITLIRSTYICVTYNKHMQVIFIKWYIIISYCSHAYNLSCLCSYIPIRLFDFLPIMQSVLFPGGPCFPSNPITPLLPVFPCDPFLPKQFNFINSFLYTLTFINIFQVLANQLASHAVYKLTPSKHCVHSFSP